MNVISKFGLLLVAIDSILLIMAKIQVVYHIFGAASSFISAFYVVFPLFLSTAVIMVLEPITKRHLIFTFVLWIILVIVFMIMGFAII
jgi:hypothetical protein